MNFKIALLLEEFKNLCQLGMASLQTPFENLNKTPP